MKLILVLACLAFGCDNLPDRPDEKTFNAAPFMEKCRLTAPRAIMCTDELMVADVRALAGGMGEGSEFLAMVEKDVANEPKRSAKHERKEGIAIHKTRCAGDQYEEYPTAVYACWAQDGCKKFVDCVTQKSAEIYAKRRAEKAAAERTGSGAESDDASTEPAGSADPARGPGLGM